MVADFLAIVLLIVVFFAILGMIGAALSSYEARQERRRQFLASYRVWPMPRGQLIVVLTLLTSWAIFAVWLAVPS